MARGDCATVGCPSPATPTTDYSWATDLRAELGGRLTGQCPCWAGTPATDVSQCVDDSADFFVMVRRRPGSALSCASYTLEISNGVNDTP